MRTVITVDETARDDFIFRLDRGGRGAGGSASSTPSTSSTPTPPTRCSRCSRSRRSNRCFSWSAMRRRGCCRPSCRAAGNCCCGRWRPTTSSVPRLRRPASRPTIPRCRRPPKRQREAWRARWTIARRRRFEAAAADRGAADGRLPRVDPRELHALGDALGGSDRVALAASSTASNAGSATACMPTRPMPTPTCPALHGWPEGCGKRSTAPRAIPNPTIWSENRWFFRCLGCLRKQRARPPHRRVIPGNLVRAIKGICSGQGQEESCQGRKAASQPVNRRALPRHRRRRSAPRKPSAP